MGYAVVDDYTNWLQGRANAVPFSEFQFWGNKASSEIDLATFNRLKDPETLAEFEAEVIATTCELAEIIFEDESPNASKKLSGYSIGGYSENYDKGETKTPQERIAGAIRRGLSYTGLLFRGA